MKIEKIPLEKLKPAAYNPRKDLREGDHEYESLKRSIREFGYLEPIIWNERTGNIIGGHQRFKILKAEGAKEAECVVVDFDEKKEKAANVALNKIKGDWDIPKLKDILVGLDDGSFDVTLTGFTMKELEELVAFGAEEVPNEDKYPEMELQPFEHYDYIVLFFKNSMDFLKACEKFGVKREGFDSGGKKKKIGLCRVVDGGKVVQ